MIDIEWLKKNTEKCIKSIEQRPVISAEQQGLLNVLSGTLALVDEVEYFLREKQDDC